MEHITLDTIRQLMKRELGSDSFIAGIVSSVKPDGGIPTACINAAGQMKYNPAFVLAQVKTEQDLFGLVFHEILHPAFGHFIHGHDEVSNVACDAIINALISQFYGKASGGGSLFERFYEPDGLESILRPGSNNGNSRYAYLYQHLYPRWTMSSDLSAGEVVQTLKMLIPEGATTPVLIGSHGGASNPWKPEQLQGIAAEVAQQISSEGGSWGNQYNGLKALIIEIMKTKRSIRQELLMDYTTRKRLDAFFCDVRSQRRTTSPFPLNPSRRDMVLLSADIWPGVFRNRQPETGKGRTGIAVFLDVSGSVNSALPEICGLLARYRRNIRSVYAFSNAVSEVVMAELMEGRVDTSYGTDFNCVAETLLDEGFGKAVVITDGYASLSNENHQKLKQAGVQLLTVLFGIHNNGAALAPFGEVVRLDEITEGANT